MGSGKKMASSLWALGISGHRSLGGLQTSLLQTNGTRLQGRAHPIFIPFSSLLRTNLPDTASPSERDKRVQELISWCVQSAQRSLLKNDLPPAVVAFDGFETLLGPSEKKSWPQDIAQSLNQQLHLPIVYGFHIQDAVNPSPATSFAAYYEAVLGAAHLNKAAEKHPHTALIVLDNETTLFFPVKGKDNLNRWSYERVWPGLDCVDEWSLRCFQQVDHDGLIASRGLLLKPLLDLWLREAQTPYISYQEQTTAFWKAATEVVSDQSPLDVCTTLTALAAQRAVDRLKKVGHITSLVLIGRGQHNAFLRTWINREFNLLDPSYLSWDESLTPSEACAYNAVRCLNRSPASLVGNSPIPFMTAHICDPAKNFSGALPRVVKDRGACDHITRN